jgi:hypothetical protein
MEKDVKEKKKNVYQKLQQCRVELQQTNLKKTGSNKFAGFKYYELADFLPVINELFNNNGLFSKFNIIENVASLEIINAENTEEIIIFTSPTAEANIKGTQPIQNLGGIHTYMKRYLYINALEIVENDLFDGKNTEQEKEHTDLLVRFNELINLTKTDREKMYDYFKVKNNTEMNREQFVEAIAIMEKKLEG